MRDAGRQKLLSDIADNIIKLIQDRELDRDETATVVSVLFSRLAALGKLPDTTLMSVRGKDRK